MGDPEGKIAQTAVGLLDDVLGLLPEPNDILLLMATLYDTAYAGEGNTLRTQRLRATLSRIDAVVNAVRSYHVTTDLARVLQSEAVMAEVFKQLGLADSGYVKMTRGDEIGHAYIGTEILARYPSGRMFVVELTYNVESRTWQIDASAKQHEEAVPIADISDEIGPTLTADAVTKLIAITNRMMRLASAPTMSIATRRLA